MDDPSVLHRRGVGHVWLGLLGLQGGCVMRENDSSMPAGELTPLSGGRYYWTPTDYMAPPKGYANVTAEVAALRAERNELLQWKSAAHEWVAERDVAQAEVKCITAERDEWKATVGASTALLKNAVRERDAAIDLLDRGERDLYAATPRDSVDVYERWRQDVRRMVDAYRAASSEQEFAEKAGAEARRRQAIKASEQEITFSGTGEELIEHLSSKPSEQETCCEDCPDGLMCCKASEQEATTCDRCGAPMSECVADPCIDRATGKASEQETTDA